MLAQAPILSNRHRQFDLPSLRAGEIRRVSLHSSINRPSIALPSPSLIVAREWYQEHNSNKKHTNAVADASTVPEQNQNPRRHSTSPTSTLTTSALASKLESMRLVSLPATLHEATDDGPADGGTEIKREQIHDKDPLSQTHYQKIQQPLPVSKLIKCEQGPKDTEMAEFCSSHNITDLEAPRRHSEASHSMINEFLHKVPFCYTHSRLQTWGHVYYLNVSTADVFVNAVNLRRPSLFPHNPDETPEVINNAKSATIRARVLPFEKGKKPFVIQKQFNLEELRSAVPPLTQKMDESSLGSGDANTLDNSQTTMKTRRASIQPPRAARHRSVPNLRARPTSSRHNSSSASCGIPIHVEYALHYLPVLAALMLSGHVKRGDHIDFTLPHPAAWPEVVRFVYTGRGEMTLAMKENILYLGGNV